MSTKNIDIRPDFSIPTPRLHISYFIPNNPAHPAFLAHLWNTPEYIASSGKTSIIDSPSAQRYLENRVTPHYVRQYGLMLVSLKPHPDATLEESTPIGTVSLWQGEPPNCYGAPDVGFCILPEHQKQGYATEAAKGLIERARHDWGVDGVFGFCSPKNATSRRVLEKIGLENRGVRNLRVFGGEESVVFTFPGMAEDLMVYGVDP
ncbi:GNAT family acetyltransferase [Aspergillus sclerotioniger CBS 115572]|uniref:GNAT family acetyltransferase n=1 Tax=Aspergillus sclerotioniger CBS 115572 TaxID=1450535 RepID=A0A317V9H3_9EURO|nr:GNAT family acetyltransferase [Aspergillus sclerotioniger CBS 115572]PWY70826.1 GNAT family acetyltransferase [Aspergillus sclerotioniger CBS 115572]